MARSAKPRKRYAFKPVLTNPLGYVLESFAPIREHDFPLMAVKIKNSAAMVALLQGRATKAEMNTLVAMSNICEALYELGFGTEYQNVCVEGRYAILSIVHRATTHGRFTPRGPEITMLNTLMELHDAQMDVITVRDLERAVELVKKKNWPRARVSFSCLKCQGIWREIKMFNRIDVQIMKYRRVYHNACTLCGSVEHTWSTCPWRKGK